MQVRISNRRQVTFPKKMMEQLNLKEGDVLELTETAEGVLLRPSTFSTEGFGSLKHLIPSGLPPLDLEKVRYEAASDPSLRD
ncbi:MAG: AbrB/MazE/SpoVT family DNA-binding domain-containing protein [Verrucomicrobiota bacterium JB022]|nr:AbrB/MazE/SpoVT family DNA-binding domain-containing protein [Verrucomicrobiota bacterium JB022]